MAMQPFDRVNVVEFTTAVAGPLLGLYMADHGATVVHVESGTKVDICRAMGPFKDNKVGINTSAFFAVHNNNKYGLALNLKRPEGIEVAKRLVSWADIIVENFAPGVMKSLGLDYEILKKIKPDTIMISTSNQGQTGPHARQPGYGADLACLCGFAQLTGWPDGYPLIPTRSAYTDYISAPFGVAAVTAALLHRRRTGRGQYLDLSQYECAMYFLAPLILDYMVNQRQMSRMGNRSSRAAPHGVYPCKGDDRWCAIAVSTDNEWQNLCEVMGSPAWTNEARFSTFPGRLDNCDDLDNLISEWTINFSPEEVMTMLQAAGVPAGVVANGQDLNNDPQLKHQHFFQELEHLEIGRHTYNKLPFTLTRTPQQLDRGGVCLGQDNEYVLRDLLGMSEKEYMDLFSGGVLE
jgi:benzylsuccinate CoA-transferase BbsF subunit